MFSWSSQPSPAPPSFSRRGSAGGEIALGKRVTLVGKGPSGNRRSLDSGAGSAAVARERRWRRCRLGAASPLTHVRRCARSAPRRRLALAAPARRTSWRRPWGRLSRAIGVVSQIQVGSGWLHDHRAPRRLREPPGSTGLVLETVLGLFDGRNRRHVAIAIRADGRRVQMPLNDTGLSDGTLLGLLRSLVVGLESLLGLLITGSRRENGGTRRNERH